MKKILTILTLSLTFLTTALIPSQVLAATQITPTGAQYSAICRTSQSIYNPSFNQYNTSVIDENGDSFTVLTINKIKDNTWLDVIFSDQNTPENKKDDIIINFNLLRNNQ